MDSKLGPVYYLVSFVLLELGSLLVTAFGQLQVDLISARDSRMYTGFEILDDDQKYVLEWIVNWPERRILFNLTVQTRGYVGFGLSKNGTMTRADTVVGGVHSNGTSYFLVKNGPDDDSGEPSQDWTLHSTSETSTHTFLSFSRPFDTCNKDDHVINTYDTTILVWCYGDTDNLTTQLCGQNCGTYPIYLLDPNVVPRFIKESACQIGPPSSTLLAQENLQLWTVSTKYKLPQKETMYHCTLHKGPRLLSKHHIVGFHYRLENAKTRRAIHHMILFACIPPKNVDPVQLFGPFVNSSGDSCLFLGKPSGQIPTQYCTLAVNGYAVGQRVVFMPDHIGYPIGQNPDEYYILQVHYDNPDLRADLEFFTNLDMFYTSKLRPHDVGVITVGHLIPGTPGLLVPPNSSSHHIYGHCGGECTADMVPPEGITLAFLNMHTHASGARARIFHYRNGVELPWILNDDNYQNTFQSFRVLHNEVKIKPGDHIVMRCTYDNRWFNGSTVVGGYSTKQEMCLSFFFYYNKLDGYPLCRSDIVDEGYLQRYLGGARNLTWDNESLEQVATSPPHLAGLSISQISNQVRWTPELRAQLQDDHRNLPKVKYCAKSPFLTKKGKKFTKGRGMGPPSLASVLYPKVDKEYVPPPRHCASGEVHKRIKRDPD